MSLRSGFYALILALVFFSFAPPAGAAPLSYNSGSPEISRPVEAVGWRCGRGWRMNRYGDCVPNRRASVCGRGWRLNRYGECVRVRPVARVCARGYHLTPRGLCVRNW